MGDRAVSSSSGCVTAGTDTTNRTTRASPSRSPPPPSRGTRASRSCTATKLVAEGTATEDEIRTWRDTCETDFPQNNTNSRVCTWRIRWDWAVSAWRRPAGIGDRTEDPGVPRGMPRRVPRCRVEFIVEDGPRGSARGPPVDRLTTTPHSPRTAVTGVDLPPPRRARRRGHETPSCGRRRRRGRGLGRRGTLLGTPTGLGEPLSRSLFPPDFEPHPHVRKLLRARRAMVSEDGGEGVDWATAELLAFGSLLLQTDDEQPHCHVRLSGQDVERGTFNHRHSVLYCARTSRAVNPLDNLGLGRQDRFVVANSPLSEHAILGFEYGYSVDSGRRRSCCGRRSLVISQTTRSASSTSSSPRARPSGGNARA